MPPHPTSADPAGLLGRTLDGRYHAVAFVGEGDLGFVYRGEQTALRRPCALKVLRPEVQRDAARLQRVTEGSQRVARGRFDALVPADDILTGADRTTLVMPWLNGEDLSAVLRAGRLSWTRARDLLLQIGEALAHLHSVGLVFPGLKPSNVFLIRNGETDTVRLLDVGLSRHGPKTASITYMAPEWLAGAEPDARTDMYNLAALAYEVLTGLPAFPGPPAQVALLKRVKPPPPPRAVAPDVVIPPKIEDILLRALEQDPRRRPDFSTFLSLLKATIPVGEDGATRFFRRSAMAPGQLTQSGELSDELHSTAPFQRFAPSSSVPTTLNLSAPIQVTRIAPLPTPATTSTDDCTLITGPPVPPAERTTISAPPAPPHEQTRIANPSPAQPQARAPHSFRSWPPAPSSPIAVADVRPAQTTAPAQPSRPDPPPLEATMFLRPLAQDPPTSALVVPGYPASTRSIEPDPSHTSRTAIIPGFGGSVLGEPRGAATPGAATVDVRGPSSRRWVWWSRFTRRFRRDDTTGKPRRPGLWARLRGVRVGHLPARRGPTHMDRFFRGLTEIPSYIGRGWRLLLRPMGRLIALRSKLSTPFMALRTSFGRLTRVISRWTGGDA